MKRSWSSGTAYFGLLFALGSSLASCATLERDVPATPLAPRPTAAEEKSRMVTAVTNSGPVIRDFKPLVDKTAASAFANTFGVSGAEVNYSGGVNCFKNGCLIEVTYRDICVAKASVDRLRYFPVPLRNWVGMIYHSPPEVLAGGQVKETWALLLPDLTDHDNRDRFQHFVEQKFPNTSSITPAVCHDQRTGTAQPAPTQGVK